MGSHDLKKKKKKHKKENKKRRRRSYSSDSSSSSDHSEDDRKVRKHRKKTEKMLASFGYTNDSNPFGDANLSQPFVWGKKYEKDGKNNVPSERELKKKQLERAEEIRKARERREQREAERAEMERLKNEELRLRDAEQYEDWQQKEEEFHLQQAKVRSKLRIKEKREKPVDLLAKNLLLVAFADIKDNDESAKMERDELLQSQYTASRGITLETRKPFQIVEVLSMDELHELRESIAEYVALEQQQQQQHGGDEAHREFWELMMQICNDRIRRLRRSQNESGNERGAIHGAVNQTIADMLDGKSTQELMELKTQVEQTIASAMDGVAVDVEYWEEVAQMITIYQARTRLNVLHHDMLEKLDRMVRGFEACYKADVRPPGSHRTRESTERLSMSNVDDSSEARAMQLAEEDKGLDESEEQFGVSDEVTLHELPAWSDKYRPRKPRYFNRVKTGYDWNKYNQTHYDQDNPPPKVVQGYKFNLFYPDLIDKHAAPTFCLERTSNPDFCILRFSAGPPYQDIAFRIVNREWEYSHKRGFKSVFERGILHLYFNFKRHRYRR